MSVLLQTDSQAQHDTLEVLQREIQAMRRARRGVLVFDMVRIMHTILTWF